MMNKKPIVLYHANCLDGTGAKYAAWKKYGDKGAHYIPVQYHQPIPECVAFTEGEEVYIVDFSYDRDTIKELRERHKSVVVLDHHETAKEELKDLEDCVFDMSKSGAVLSWEYFHPNKQVPLLLRYVQDRDLWNWKLDGTKDFTTGLTTYEGDMNLWDTKPIKDTLTVGKVLNTYIDSKVDYATKEDRVSIITFMSKTAGILNSTVYASEIGTAINSKYKVDMAIIYFIDISGNVILSFRSDKNKPGFVDVSEIAKSRFEGGGHKPAAGGKTNLETLHTILKGDYK